jgi:NADPH:quinone reductase-like Zn-dependent oxidoreductase
MKAIHLTAYGGNPAQSLVMVEVSEPNAPSEGEVLVRMEYAPIDDSDLLLANGMYFLNPKLPSVIGAEGAGIVEAIGPGVTSNWPDVAKQQSVGLRRPLRIYRSSPRYRPAVPQP